jgi:hypothetical protein
VFTSFTHRIRQVMAELYQFHVSLHARPDEARPGPSRRLRGLDLPTVAVDASHLSLGFSISFEEACERLGKLPRMFVEGDGSFVWVGPAASRWQVDGQFIDRGGRLLLVDLRGTTPPADFDALLTALGWPQTRLLFQLAREAVFLEEAEFRRYAGARGS